MTGSFPTFKRLLAAVTGAWSRFSYQESILAQGAVWTLVCWLPSAVYCLVPYELVRQWGGAEGGVLASLPVEGALFLLVFPGSLVMAFIAAQVLSGGASGLLDSLKRGFKAVAVLFIALLALALAILLTSHDEGALVGVIVSWIAAAVLICGFVGGAARYYYDKKLGTRRPAKAGAPGPAAAPGFPAGEREWLEAAAGALRAEGLLDHATASAFHRRLQESGQAAPDGPMPLEEKYAAARAAALARFRQRDGSDWLAANAELRRAALIAAKAGPGSRAALEAAYTGFSPEFYAWAEECARRLP